MKRESSHDQDKEKAIASGLLAATRLTESEIDRIASAPHLFGSIRTRIAEQNISNEKAPSNSPAFGWLGGKAFAAAAVVVMVLAAAAFLVMKREASPIQAVAPPPLPEIRPVPQRFDAGQATVARSSEPDREVGRSLPEHISENAIVKEYVRKPQPARKGKSNKGPRTEELDFYALNASAWETRDGRIVRVTLPRASLVALGANISLEGDRQNVTADLLVGADGVPRAIRVVE
jgi:hypothetical protein